MDEVQFVKVEEDLTSVTGSVIPSEVTSTPIGISVGTDNDTDVMTQFLELYQQLDMDTVMQVRQANK